MFYINGLSKEQKVWFSRNEKKIFSKVREINRLIRLADELQGMTDESISVTDPSSTFEQDYFYTEVTYNSYHKILTLKYKKGYGGKIYTDKIKASEIEFDGMYELNFIIRRLKASLRKALRNVDFSESYYYYYLPERIKAVFNTHDDDIDIYENARSIIEKLNRLGWTADFDLGGSLFDLKPIL